MGTVTQALMPRKARLQALADGVARLEAERLAQQPIQVFRIARCGHPECGAPPSAAMPADALVIEMGCGHAVPQIEMPAPEAAAIKTRAERPSPSDLVGQGLPEARHQKLLRTIKLL